MTITYEITDEHVDYAAVAALMREVEISSLSTELVEKSFKNSLYKVFAFDEKGQLVACGRALSDGVLQGNIYNIAVSPTQQGKGLGKAIIQNLLVQLDGQIVTLYTHPKTFSYYEQLGFSNLKTGFIRFLPDEKQWFVDEGFIDK
ncbi:N-acetyltransferase [Lactococcus hodotermopsidis]|uniref:N-acetyltransferase n=1 Tax=Pseudolactococcus hodotermopsidis TaxID=2709157 RepID=A0A6A0BB99_9LACT|nr:GNAT family N-acetyltransferase [Lactococcus hodotermopsidis]GFH42622.1 N-acetyltransferase [Lactococcus hodotermopsidis]